MSGYHAPRDRAAWWNKDRGDTAWRDAGRSDSLFGDTETRTLPAGMRPVTPFQLTMARAAYVLFCFAAVTRLMLVDDFINLFYPYTLPGGILPGKIHPSNYLILLSALMIYAGPGFRFREQDYPVLRATLLFGGIVTAIITLNLLQGRAGAVGYAIDTYICTLVAMLTMLAFPYRWRTMAALLLVGSLVFNSFLAMGEFATGRYIIPADELPEEFRPSGLLGASLNVGVNNLAAAILLLSTRYNVFIRAAGVGVLWMAIFISASRTAMVMGAILTPVAILATTHVRKDGFSSGAAAIVMLLSAIIAVPLILLGASELGFLKRFSDGLVDDSAKTRVEIFKVFDYVEWRDVVFGTDVDRIREIALHQLGIIHIESPFITFIFSFGAPLTVLFLFFLLYLFYRLARETHPAVSLAVLGFLVTALSNNTLSTKVPSFFTAVVLFIGIRAYHRRVNNV
ncbi:MAG: VpsF family polysaccharide biosynthesis protein [Beijerinckiaceae bacterium]